MAEKDEESQKPPVKTRIGVTNLKRDDSALVFDGNKQQLCPGCETEVYIFDQFLEDRKFANFFCYSCGQTKRFPVEFFANKLELRTFEAAVPPKGGRFLVFTPEDDGSQVIICERCKKSSIFQGVTAMPDGKIYTFCVRSVCLEASEITKDYLWAEKS